VAESASKNSYYADTDEHLPDLVNCQIHWVRIFDSNGEAVSNCLEGKPTDNSEIKFDLELSFNPKNRVWVVISPTELLHEGIGSSTFRTGMLELNITDSHKHFSRLSLITLGSDINTSTFIRGGDLKKLPVESKDGDSQYRRATPEY